MKTNVVITNYNQGKFAYSALDSIYKQTHLPTKIIIVDDCSTDNSVELIKQAMAKFKNKIATELIVRETNGKPAGARNSGIRNLESDCEVVAFLDIDDFYAPEKIQASINVLRKYPLVGLVYTDYNMYDVQKNNFVREFKHPFDFNILAQVCIVSTNSIIRRKVLDKVGLFDEKYYGVEDYQMWLRIALESMVHHIAEPLFTYRIHGGNLSTNNTKFMESQIPQLKQELFSGNYKPPR